MATVWFSIKTTSSEVADKSTRMMAGTGLALEVEVRYFRIDITKDAVPLGAMNGRTVMVPEADQALTTVIMIGDPVELRGVFGFELAFCIAKALEEEN